jgi:ABC-type transport system involved in multi-copper enzyme maturation permease subunit
MEGSGIRVQGSGANQGTGDRGQGAGTAITLMDKLRDMVRYLPTKGRTLVEMSVKNILYDRKTLVFFGLSMFLLIIPGYWAYSYDGSGIRGLDLFVTITMLVYLQFIVLYACMLFGASLFAEEEENKTLTYLTSRPVSTFELVIYKYIGFVASVFVLFLIPLLLNFAIIATHTSYSLTSDFMFELGQYLGLMFVAVAAWGALFMFFGVFFRKYSLMVGLLYALLWETFVANIGAGIKFATVNYYIRSLAPVSFGSAAGETPWGQALAAMVGLAAACILLTWYFQRGKDYN